MRRRITIAIVSVVVGTLVLTVAGSLLLVRRAATSTAQSELVTQAQSLGQLLSSSTQAADQRVLRVVKEVGSYSYISVVGLSHSGTFSDLPSTLTASDLDPAALQQGKTVGGNVGNLVYTGVPITLTSREMALRGLSQYDHAVLVVTREVTNPVNGLVYFLVVAGVLLLVAAAVAAFLARRISAPLVRAAAATRKVAAGDLEARVRVSPTDDPELKELGHAINSLGESLGRARGLERQFLLSVSHELRTPLTSIRGYADAVADGATEDVAGAAAIIGSEARRLERLVQDLLDLARLAARQFSLHVQRVDAKAIAHSVVEGARPEAESSHIELVSSIAGEDELWVDADPDRLAQIVANLIENAFKFASRRVEVGAMSDGTYCAIWVDDDGPGISQSDLPKVFDRHFKSDRVPARRAGSGLGLAIVAELASAMGAEVRAESPVTPFGGTRMVVWSDAKPEPSYLPVPAPPAPPTNTPPPQRGSGDTSGRTRTSPRIDSFVSERARGGA